MSQRAVAPAISAERSISERHTSRIQALAAFRGTAMSKPLKISVALAALLVTAAPAMAQRHPGPSKLRDADHTPPTAAIAVPALIRARAQPDQTPVPGDDAAAGHVKVFDGAGGAALSAGEPQPAEPKKMVMSVRKAGEPPSNAQQPDGEESAAARMQTQNNLKQIGLANH
jgi:hypothetical protein